MERPRVLSCRNCAGWGLSFPTAELIQRSRDETTASLFFFSTFTREGGKERPLMKMRLALALAMLVPAAAFRCLDPAPMTGARHLRSGIIAGPRQATSASLKVCSLGFDPVMRRREEGMCMLHAHAHVRTRNSAPCTHQNACLYASETAIPFPPVPGGKGRVLQLHVDGRQRASVVVREERTACFFAPAAAALDGQQRARVILFLVPVRVTQSQPCPPTFPPNPPS